MKNLIVSACLVAVACVGCSAAWLPDPCPGQQECSDGTCADLGRVCCGNDTSCPSGYTCGVGECLAVGGVVPGVVQTVEGCLQLGEEPCIGIGGVIECMGLGRTCCIGTGYNCAGNQSCSGNCGYQCCNLSITPS